MTKNEKKPAVILVTDRVLTEEWQSKTVGDQPFFRKLVDQLIALGYDVIALSSDEIMTVRGGTVQVGTDVLLHEGWDTTAIIVDADNFGDEQSLKLIKACRANAENFGLAEEDDPAFRVVSESPDLTPQLAELGTKLIHLTPTRADAGAIAQQIKIEDQKSLPTTPHPKVLRPAFAGTDGGKKATTFKQISDIIPKPTSDQNGSDPQPK